MIGRKFLFIAIIVFCVLGCKSKVNQIVNHKPEGKWITVDTLEFIYSTKGRYHNGQEVGKWKHFYNGKLVRKEKFNKNGICKNVFYHSNGKIMKKGNVKLESNIDEDHWYYFGKWKFYDKEGKLDSIKIYKKENFKDSLVVKK